MKKHVDGLSNADRLDILMPTAQTAVLRKIGKVIHEAVTNEAACEAFSDHPNAVLAERVPELKAMLDRNTVIVHEDRPDATWNIVLPESVCRIDQMSAADFESYLMELGYVTIMGCKYGRETAEPVWPADRATVSA